MGILVVVCNVFEIMLIIRNQKRKMFERTLLSLSVADFLFGFKCYRVFVALIFTVIRKWFVCNLWNVLLFHTYICASFTVHNCGSFSFGTESNKT